MRSNTYRIYVLLWLSELRVEAAAQLITFEVVAILLAALRTIQLLFVLETCEAIPFSTGFLPSHDLHLIRFIVSHALGLLLICANQVPSIQLNLRVSLLMLLNNITSQFLLLYDLIDSDSLFLFDPFFYFVYMNDILFSALLQLRLYSLQLGEAVLVPLHQRVDHLVDSLLVVRRDQCLMVLVPVQR